MCGYKAWVHVQPALWVYVTKNKQVYAGVEFGHGVAEPESQSHMSLFALVQFS
jgi:hypothetical protein